MLLLSYQAPRPRSVYGQPTAVFLCAHACERFERPNTIADIVNNRLVSFRAFRHDGMMIYDANRIGEGGNYDDVRPERCCLHQCTHCQSRLHALPDRASLMFRKRTSAGAARLLGSDNDADRGRGVALTCPYERRLMSLRLAHRGAPSEWVFDSADGCHRCINRPPTGDLPRRPHRILIGPVRICPGGAG